MALVVYEGAPEAEETRLIIPPERVSERRRKPMPRFNPEPVSAVALRALLAEGGTDGRSTSEITADEAEAALKRKLKKQEEEAKAAAEAAAQAEYDEAATPRELPFSLPPREDRPEQPALLLTCSDRALAEQLQAAEQQTSYATRKKRETFRAADDGELCAADPSEAIGVVSEYSGIGALEHGMQAGFEEAGLAFLLTEACETAETVGGRHAAAVLRKRYPHVLVLKPDEREANPYPANAKMVNVTAQCTQHSGLNVMRSPWLTEETMLDPVLERLENAPQIECVVLENVPNFARCLDGQERSSYSYWVKGLNECGFTEHAYVILPTAAAGDLHYRTRLLSVSTKGAFHPAAALMRLLTVDEDVGASSSSSNAPLLLTNEAADHSEVFAFTTGLSETRHQAKGDIGHVFGHLPAYNTGLNVALYVRGSYYKLSPWLAARCSGLPDDYQSVWDFGDGKDKPKTRPTQTCLATALGNMVSPLQARELGFAIAREWKEPRQLASVSMLANAPNLPLEYSGSVPYEFPTTRAEATLCFSSVASGRWHRITGRAFHRVGPAATLDQLCDEALRREEISHLTSFTDLNRCVDEAALKPHHRKAAAVQYERIQTKANDALRKESKLALKPKGKKIGGRKCVWAQCDECLRWRRLNLPPAGAAELPDRWVCSMNPSPPYNRCDMQEEEMAEDECSRDWVPGFTAPEEPFTADNDRWLIAMSERIGPNFGWEDVKRRQMKDFAFDHYFKSRTAKELEARANELKRRRSGAIVPAASQEEEESPQEQTAEAEKGMWAILGKLGGRVAQVGERVQGKYEGKEGGVNWFYGYVTSVDVATGCVGIKYDDGDKEEGVQPKFVKVYSCGAEVDAGLAAIEEAKAIEKVAAAEEVAVLEGDAVEGAGEEEGEEGEGWKEARASFLDQGEEEEGEEDDRDLKVFNVPAAEITRHHIYGGAQAGSLTNVYVRIRYSDGTFTNDDKSSFEPSWPLAATPDGPEVLVKYCRSKAGQGMAKYLPANVIEATTVVDAVEAARRKGVMSAVKEAAMIRAISAERVEAKRKREAEDGDNVWPRMRAWQAKRQAAQAAAEAEASGVAIVAAPRPLPMVARAVRRREEERAAEAIEVARAAATAAATAVGMGVEMAASFAAAMRVQR